MTKEQFIREVIEIYRKSRSILLPVGWTPDDKLRRGRNHVASGQMEDLFAYYLLSNYPCIEKICVDQPLSILEPGKKSPVIYPDLMLIQNNLIKALVDIKTDVGRNRKEVENLVIESSKAANNLRSKSLFYNDGMTKERFAIRSDDNLQNFIVVISKKNIKKTEVDGHIEKIQANKELSNTKLYFLTDGIHPNKAIYSSQLEKISILPEFDELMMDMGKIFNANPAYDHV
jgi:hypothetical protein